MTVTSLGALNTTLFAQGNLEKAEGVWLHISPEKIVTVDLSRILFGARRDYRNGYFLN